jgi:hypothetical protein
VCDSLSLSLSLCVCVRVTWQADHDKFLAEQDAYRASLVVGDDDALVPARNP